MFLDMTDHPDFIETKLILALTFHNSCEIGPESNWKGFRQWKALPSLQKEGAGEDA